MITIWQTEEDKESYELLCVEDAIRLWIQDYKKQAEVFYGIIINVKEEDLPTKEILVAAKIMYTKIGAQ